MCCHIWPKQICDYLFFPFLSVTAAGKFSNCCFSFSLYKITHYIMSDLALCICVTIYTDRCGIPHILITHIYFLTGGLLVNSSKTVMKSPAPDKYHQSFISHGFVLFLKDMLWLCRHWGYTTFLYSYQRLRKYHLK